MPAYVGLPILFVIIEWLKSLGSFGNTNGNIGFSLSTVAHAIPSYSIIGYLGMGMIIMIINVLIIEIIKR